MAGSFEVSGADQFLALSKALKNAGHKELRKTLNKNIKTAVKPLIAETRAEARRTLPHRGGYGALVARAPQRIQVRTGAQTAGVRLVVARDRSSARRANMGVIRHPVFGNREVWVDQRLAVKGWFDVPAKAARPRILSAVEAALADTVSDIVRGVR